MREYRQNAHAGSLIVWTLLCVATAVVLFVYSDRTVGRAAAAGLLAMGPLVLTAYLLRSRLVWVGVDRDRGIVVGGRRTIPWTEIARIERKRPALRSTTGPADVTGPDVKSWASGCMDPAGCLAGEAALIILGVVVIFFALFLAFWIIFFVFIPVVVVPVLEVLLPVGDRVKIVTKTGRGLLLRDLRDADSFLADIGTRVPISRD